LDTSAQSAPCETALHNPHFSEFGADWACDATAEPGTAAMAPASSAAAGRITPMRHCFHRMVDESFLLFDGHPLQSGRLALP
jgi:hypothetical protein